MSQEFKDHFSGHANDYRTYRPQYPAEFYSWLSSLCIDHERAWDCATGTGQAAVGLAPHFSEVIATDGSEQQIKNAIASSKVHYRVATAEHSGIRDASVDLITVAQAIHWFDADDFAKEVERVLKPGGVIAVWSYGMLTINDAIDQVVNHLYGPVLEDYWPEERRLVEAGYAHVEFPYEKIQSPPFVMASGWNLAQLVGYLNTWSAVKKYIQRNNSNPVDAIYADLLAASGDPDNTKDTIYKVSWPLTILIWRKSA